MIFDIGRSGFPRNVPLVLGLDGATMSDNLLYGSMEDLSYLSYEKQFVIHA